MGLTIQTNVAALNAQNHLERNQNRLNDTLEKVGSGNRINRAADDAAGLAISDNLRADIRSLNQGVRNAEDGISLVQVYEGGTREISAMLTRTRELAMQAATDTVSDRERELIQYEVTEIIAEIDRLASTTKFIGQDALLAGEALDIDFQVGKNNVDEVDRIRFAPGNLDLTSGGLSVDGLDFTTRDEARTALDTIDEAIFGVNSVRAQVGAMQNRLTNTVNAQRIQIENLEAANSRIRDADIAVESTNLARNGMLRQAGVAVLAQANQTPALALRLLQG